MLSEGWRFASFLPSPKIGRLPHEDASAVARKYQCPKKASGAKDGGNNCQSARAHASMKTAPKVCPACSGQHSFNDKGDLLFRTCRSSFPDFCNLGPVDRAYMLQSAKGCQLCLDWTHACGAGS